MSSICTTPVYTMTELNNLFIEMTAKNCNQRCKSCYMDFPSGKPSKDFISTDLIKECLNDTTKEKINCIYLTGGEPMTHPDFNTILRLCLKRSNVCICTNGSFLNEKKVRFINKVENEENNICENQIFFNLSLTHYNELENDKAKYRGNFRQTIFALKTLSAYNFSSVLTIQNFYNLDEKIINENFAENFKKQGIFNTDIKIIPSYTKNDGDFTKTAKNPDCLKGRCLSSAGIYVCPFLSSDYRGRVGSSFKDFSKTFRAETDFCSICSMSNIQIFSIQ